MSNQRFQLNAMRALRLAAARNLNPGKIVAVRIGDYYELYCDEAEKIAKAAEITLTNLGDEDKTPMCGFPFYNAERYVEHLATKGIEVVLYEEA